jgi:hypothetical protein
MDINEQLQPIVASLIDSLRISIEQELRDKVSNEIVNKLASTEIDAVISNLVKQQINSRLDHYDFAAASKEELDKSVTQLTAQVNKTLVSTATSQVTNNINHQLAQLDLNVVINSVVQNKLDGLLQTQQFPTNSISHDSIDFRGLQLSGDLIKGGIIEHFGSTGIEDRSSFVQLTLMDHASAFEGPIYAPSAEIKGNLTVDGSLIVLGKIDTNTPIYAQLTDSAADKVKASLNDELFGGFSDIIFDKIKTEGLDLDRITQGGKDVVKGNQVGYHITDSNLQRLGMVRDLQTQGEAYLSETFYVTKGRVGVNTMDPTAAVSIWDQEVEIMVGKRKQDTGYIAAARFQNLVIGSNNKDNLTVKTDGSVQIDNLSVGKVPMASARQAPTIVGQRGQILWNEVPQLGGPIGWVCLGDTTWAKFGKIE